MAGGDRRPEQLAAAIAAGDARHRALNTALATRRRKLPLRYWRQHAHFTTPAADLAMARKAIEGGTSAMVRILERLGISAAELGDRLGVDSRLIQDLLDRPARAPLVMLDGEDAQALREDVTQQGLKNASDLLVEADWGASGTLRFFRPPGFDLRTSVRDLYTVLWSVGERSTPHTFPLDGIVFPKVEHPEQVGLLYGLLADAEAAIGLPRPHIQVALLVESAWAVAQLPEIVRRAAPRLCALIFGLADYAADLGLPSIVNDHPVADWARAEIVNLAAAVGVPAIDAMTLAYPVPEKLLDAASNRARFMDRMALVYEDSVHSREIGMSGKWVGHPAQLFAVLLAHEVAFSPELLNAEAAKLEAYKASVEGEAKGATMIEGVMSDRATDRHARALLRQATALGRFEPGRALSLTLIDEAEVPEARVLWAIGSGRT
jgi:citrate lyase beta subunit